MKAGTKMRNAIFEFLEPTEEEKQHLWQEATFIFDTNVLLNLYRYSEKTRKILLSAIEEFHARIWLPHHIAYEFMKNRSTVIFEMTDLYSKLGKEADAFKDKCLQSLRLKSTDQEISELHDYISHWINANKIKNLLVVNPVKDPILEKILFLYDGNVGTEYGEEKRSQVNEEGLKRYQKLIPPGYKDFDKKRTGNEDNIFGDLIIWKQLMSYSKEKMKDIVYVTHDQKEDWWNIVRGKTIGPRMELRKEFYSFTSQKFDMYSMDSFISRFGELHGDETDQSVIDEIRHIDTNNINLFRKKISSSKERLENTISRLQYQIEKREKVISIIEHKYCGKKVTDDIQMQVNNTKAKIKQLKEQLIKAETDYELAKHNHLELY